MLRTGRLKASWLRYTPVAPRCTFYFPAGSDRQKGDGESNKDMSACTRAERLRFGRWFSHRENTLLHHRRVLGWLVHATDSKMAACPSAASSSRNSSPS